MNKKIEALAEVKTFKGNLESEKRLVNEYRAQMAGLAKRKAQIQDMIDNLDKLSEAVAYESSLKGETVKLASKEAEIADLSARLADLKEELEGAEMLCQILGNGGVKSYIFDSVTPELNKIIAEYMAILNPDISVEISTVSKLKSKDEYREKFCIKVENVSGASQYEGSSGGERQMINLAIALGFNTICRAMSEGSVNVLFLDEPLENLDEGSSEQAIALCQRFIKSIPNVFIVSHNPAIRDLVSDKITIEKRAGMARVAA